jgi:hypothetical protein
LANRYTPKPLRVDWNAQVKLEPPIGSKISVTREGTYTLIVVPQNDGVARYAAGLFLLAWLGGWFVGLKRDREPVFWCDRQ